MEQSIREYAKETLTGNLDMQLSDHEIDGEPASKEYMAGIERRDYAMHNALISLCEACDIPLDVPMPVQYAMDNEGNPNLADAEWQLVQDEEQDMVYKNSNPYAVIEWSCRGTQYIITAYCAQGDRYFVGTDESEFGEVFGEVRHKNIPQYRRDFAELAKH